MLQEESKRDEDTNSICELNEKIKSDDRVDMVLLTIGDGLTLVCVK